MNRARLESLTKFKTKLLEIQVDLESGEADTLSRFDVQVYPVK